MGDSTNGAYRQREGCGVRETGLLAPFSRPEIS
jgi:hypothetical protein